MPGMRRRSLDYIRCKQVVYCNTMFTSILCFTYIFVRQTREKQWIVICDKLIISRGFGYRPQYQHSTIISHPAKALGLIMGSDTCFNLGLCIRETPKRVFLQMVKTHMKCSIMLHFIRVYTVCPGKKNLKTKNTVCKGYQQWIIHCFLQQAKILDLVPIWRHALKGKAKNNVEKFQKMLQTAGRVSHQNSFFLKLNIQCSKANSGLFFIFGWTCLSTKLCSGNPDSLNPHFQELAESISKNKLLQMCVTVQFGCHSCRKYKKWNYAVSVLPLYVVVFL